MCRPDGRKYNGEYKNNLKHGHGVWTWPDGVMLEGQWAENLPCRHACTGITCSSVRQAVGCGLCEYFHSLPPAAGDGWRLACE